MKTSFPPGGAMDAIARSLGEKAARALGQPVVIENKPGAGGNIGADFVAKAPADGYTMMGVPTLAEAGLPGYEVSPWFAVFVPAGTPKPIVARLNATLLEAMKQPEVRAKFEAIGAEAIGSSPEELAAHLQRETARWSKLIAERNIKPD